jgi:glutaredoxin
MLETYTEPELEIPEKKKKKKEVEVVDTEPVEVKTEIKTVKEDVLVPVLFTKAIECAGKCRKIHDIDYVLQSELDKLPPKTYLVRKVK